MITYLFALALQAAVPTTQASELATLRAADQGLLDAIAPGDRASWDRRLAENAIYVDENGKTLDRAKFLEDLKPLPAGSSGHITIIAYDGVIRGNVALVRHRDDEREEFHGVSLHAEYLMTETWLRENGGWKLALTHAYVVAVDPPAIPLDDSTMEGLLGVYRLADLTFAIRREDRRLIRVTGEGERHPLLAETRDALFTPAKPRSRFIVKRDKDGKVLALVERREGEDLIWSRALPDP